MDKYLEGIKVAFSGAHITLSITIVSVAMGIFIGLFVALARISEKRILRVISTVYIDVLRGTPLVVQALLIYYGLPNVLQNGGIDFKWSSAMIAGMLVCGINSSAYVAEIMRSGLNAVDKGQMEAARSLGMTKAQAMRLVIIPQAVKVIIPALGNEFISLLKETAVLSFITITDITRKSMLWTAATFQSFPAYIGTAICYMMLTIPLSKFMNALEGRMGENAKN